MDVIEESYLASTRFSTQDLSEKILKAAKDFTGSGYGFAAYLDRQTGWMIAPTLSGDAWKGRRPPSGQPVIFKEFGGLWGWTLINKKPLLTNAAASDPRSGGTPPGHIKIEKFLAVPAIFNRSLAGIIALANPKRNYNADDLAAVKKLARVYALILQRKLAEDRLKESESRYSAIIDASRDIIYTYNPDGRITYVSRQVRVYGYTQEEIIGRHILEFAHPDDRYFLSQALAKGIKTGVTTPVIHCRIKKKDGSYFHAEQKSGIIKQDGRIFMFSAIIRDVSERDELRARLVKNEETLRQIFDTATDAIFIKDMRGRYTRVNKACATVLGLPLQKMLGKTDFNIFPKEIAKAIKASDQQVIRTGNTVYTDIAFPGVHRCLHAAKTPLKDGNGAVIGILGIARDITELKRLQAELIKAKAVEAVTSVARPAAHDFNNILAAINGYAVLVMETLRSDNPVKPEIAQILKAVKRASAITSQLQSYGSKTTKERT
jgi:PAS domain S-box-containing protein